MSRYLESAWRWVGGALVVVAVLAVGGCGKQPAPQTPESAKPKGTNAIAAAKAAPGAEVGTNAVALVEFIDDPALGKDPFFPNSTRRQPRVVSTNTPATVVSAAQVGYSNLSLKAIVGPKNRRLATINRTTMEAGEEAEVRYPGGKVMVKCLEVRSDSVLIEINGERRELTFRGGSK